MAKKINLLYDASCLAPHLKDGTGTGIYTVAYNILKELANRKNFSIELYCEQNRLENLLKGLKKESSKIRKLKVFTGNDYGKFSAFFSPMFAIPQEIKNFSNIRKYLFLHDIIPYLYPDHFEQNANRWYYAMFNSINANDYYFMNSLNTQNDFIKYNRHITKDNSTVAYLACDKQFKSDKIHLQKVLKKYNLPTDKKYIFSLCTLEPRKNLIRAIKTFIEFIEKHKIDDMVFILGGGSWKTFMAQLENELNQFGTYKDKILKAGYVDNEDLPALYSGAEWFVYTSKYEGFGLPPLEAMSCGCPVITSNNSALPEVVGNAGITIDWDSDEQHIAAYEKYYFDAKFRNSMAAKGLENAENFSWAKTVDTIENTIIQHQMLKPKAATNNLNTDKLNLLFDANLLANGLNNNHTRSGVYFVVNNILKALIKQPNIQIFLSVSDKNLKSVKTVIKNDDTLKYLPFASETDYRLMDAYLSPHGDIPDKILSYGHIRTYKIVHDFMGCIFPDRIFGTKLENHQRGIWCNKLFCISESTKRDYLKFVPQIDENKLLVTYEGANENFYPRTKKEVEDTKNKFGIKNRYIFSVCNLTPHKNLLFSIEAFIHFIKKNKIDDLYYVLGGSIPDYYKEEVEEKLQSLGKYRDKIILTGYLQDEDMPLLYSGAEWFVFPSLYEGFGLPILEAMQCGCPVVCSKTSSMPEILGNCGILADPYNQADFVDAFQKMYESATFRQKCRNEGLLRAKDFSWENMSQQIASVIVEDSKPQDNAKLPIVLITDENYVNPTIVTITSALANKYNNTDYQFYILGNFLSKTSIDLFKEIPNVEVINFTQAFKEFEGTHQHVSAAALLKFKIPDIFSDIEKILYIDTDVIIQKDLSELFNLDISNCYAAAVKDIECMMHGKHHVRLNLQTYFNSGMMLLNLKKMQADNISEKLVEYKKNDVSKHFMDQDAFNKVFAENIYNISPLFNFIPVSWSYFTNDILADFYGLSYEDIKHIQSHAAICHLANKMKPWKYRATFGAELWAKYYYSSPLKHKKIEYLDNVVLNQSAFSKIEKFFSLFYSKKAGKYARHYRILGLNLNYYKKYINKEILYSRLKDIDFKITGFSHAESWGRWSNGYHSTMILNLKKFRQDLLFTFNVIPFFTETLNQQNVSVYANDRQVAQWSFIKGKPLPATKFIIPADLISKNGKLFLRFEYENATSPRELMIGDDARKLALGFKNLRITPKVYKETFLTKLFGKFQNKTNNDLAAEIILLRKMVSSLQGEIKQLRNEQAVIEKILVDKRTWLQKKRKIK